MAPACQWEEMTADGRGVLDECEREAAHRHALPFLAVVGGDPIMHPRFWDLAAEQSRSGRTRFHPAMLHAGALAHDRQFLDLGRYLSMLALASAEANPMSPHRRRGSVPITS